MSKMKNLGRILVLLILMVIPMQAYANAIPIMIPMPIRVGQCDLETSQGRIEQYRGLSKITDKLLNLEITKEDYKQLYPHFKDKRDWTAKTIEYPILKNMKANDFILVHDANVNQVYEIPQEEIQAFIKEKYKDVDLEKDYDAIVFMTGSQTVEKKLTKVPMQYGNTKFTMDLTDEQITQVKELLQLNENKTELLGLVKITITLDNNKIKTDAQTMKLIMQKLDTPIAKSVLKESKTIYDDTIFFKGMVTLLITAFCLLISVMLSDILGKDLTTKCATIALIIVIIILLLTTYCGIFVRPKL